LPVWTIAKKVCGFTLAVLAILGCAFPQPTFAVCRDILGRQALDFGAFDKAKLQLEAQLVSQNQLSRAEKQRLWSDANTAEEKLALIEFFANRALGDKSNSADEPHFHLTQENSARVYALASKVFDGAQVTLSDVLDILNAYEVNQRLTLLRPSTWRVWFQSRPLTAAEIVARQWKHHLAAKGITSEIPEIADVADISKGFSFKKVLASVVRVIFYSLPELGALKRSEVAAGMDEVEQTLLTEGADRAFLVFAEKFQKKSERFVRLKRFQQYINLAAAIVFFGTVGYQLHTELYPIDAMFAGTDPYLETLVASAQAEHFTRYGREMTEREIEIFKGSFRALRAIDLKEMAIRHTPQEAN
jgi:hypothetical protein